MALVYFPPKNKCIHHGIHPNWIAQGQHIAVCSMALPYLLNCINLTERILQEAYPFIAQQPRSPLTLQEIKETEDQLNMLKVELQRRNA